MADPLQPRPAALGAAHVVDFCRSIAPAAQARSVFCLAEDGAALDDCFPLVECMVAREGGRLVLGWALWERPGFLIEAELHAVWQQPQGRCGRRW